MQESFWHQRWAQNEIAFHLRAANPLLVNYFSELAVPVGGRVLVPLCGKTLDIHWLLAHGYRVVGSELSQIAVEQLFSDLGVTPEITIIDHVKRYRAESIDLWVGDIFNLSRSLIGPIDAVYDRGALVALPDPIRARYAAHLTQITAQASQLLISYTYDPSLHAGPPFSVSHEEVGRHYQKYYNLKLLVSADVVGGLKGMYPASENVWHLKKKMEGHPGQLD